jgi:hypothetical protein
MNSGFDITSGVKEFIYKFATNNEIANTKKNLEDTIKFIDVNNIIIFYNGNSISPEVHLVKDGKTIGYFSIVDLLPDKTPSMSISIGDDEDESYYRGKGLARLLIASMIYVIKNNNPHLTPMVLLFIDTDASNGFWDKIGMIENRYYLRKIDVIGRGHEKHIDLATISDWALNNNAIFRYGGGRTNTKSRTKKSQQKVAIKNRTKRLQQKVAIKNRKKSRNKKGNGQI